MREVYCQGCYYTINSTVKYQTLGIEFLVIQLALYSLDSDNLITENFPRNGLKLESVGNKIRGIFIQCLVFNKTTIFHSRLLDVSL